MILIPPLLHALVGENKIDQEAVFLYRILKVYKFNNKRPKLGQILSDTELDEKKFRILIKQLEEYGFIERKRNPGHPTDYVLDESVEIK